MIESVSTAVAQDMERVFSRPSASSATMGHPSSMASSPSWRTRLGGGRAIWLALIPAGGLAAGLIAVSGMRDAPSKANAVPQYVSARPLPAPPAPVAEQEIPVSASAPPRLMARHADATDAPLALPANPERREPVSTKPVRAPSRAANRPKPPAPARVVSETPPCRDASDQARCFYQEVLKADHRLRQAYGQATASSVPVSDMIRIRRAWKAALSRSRKTPLEAIRTLDGLTDDLRDARSSSSRPE